MMDGTSSGWRNVSNTTVTLIGPQGVPLVDIPPGARLIDCGGWPAVVFDSKWTKYGIDAAIEPDPRYNKPA